MYKVYFTEDEEYVRRAIIDTTDWESAGFTICGEAEDGETALREILQLRPDVLITDIKMPKMNGLELSHLAKKELPDLIVIILSGYDEFDFTQQAIHIGVSDYILKPIVPAKLMRVLLHAAQLLEQKDDERRKKEVVAPALGRNFAKKPWMNQQVVNRTELFNAVKTMDHSSIQPFAEKQAKAIWDASNNNDVYFTCYLYDFFTTLRDAMGSMGISCNTVEAFQRPEENITGVDHLEKILYTCMRQVIRTRDEMADSRSQVVVQAKLFMEDHHSNPELSLGMVADAVNIAPNYLSTLINKKSGQSFSEILNQIRIKHSMELLRTTSAPLSEIARMVGYNDPYYLSKIFKKVLGITPNEFRKMI